MNKQSKHADAQSNETFYNEVPYQGSSLPQVRMVRASKSHASAVFLIRTRGEFDNNGVSEEGEGQERGGGGGEGARHTSALLVVRACTLSVYTFADSPQERALIRIITAAPEKKSTQDKKRAAPGRDRR